MFRRKEMTVYPHHDATQGNVNIVAQPIESILHLTCRFRSLRKIVFIVLLACFKSPQAIF